LLRKAAGAARGSPTPGLKQPIGSVTRSQLREIAQQKLADLNARDIEKAEKIIAGTARSMGIQIVDS